VAVVGEGHCLHRDPAAAWNVIRKLEAIFSNRGAYSSREDGESAMKSNGYGTCIRNKMRGIFLLRADWVV
jgi:hypothetical protein